MITQKEILVIAAFVAAAGHSCPLLLVSAVGELRSIDGEWFLQQP
jgi:hypothetical protein